MTAIIGYDLSSRRRTLNAGFRSLISVCSSNSASVSVPVTVTSTSATRITISAVRRSMLRTGRVYELTRLRSAFALPT